MSTGDICGCLNGDVLGSADPGCGSCGGTGQRG